MISGKINRNYKEHPGDSSNQDLVEENKIQTQSHFIEKVVNFL